MNPNYSNLKPSDPLINPFRKAQGSKLNEIMRNKGGLAKYIIAFVLIVGFIICSIILITKSSQLKQIAKEKENYEHQIKEIQVSNEDLLRNIKEIEASVNKLNKEKNDLIKEENELKQKKEELVQQNKVNYDKEIQMLQDQLEAATKRYDQMKKDNPNIDKDKNELEAMVKKYRSELASLQDEYDKLKNELNEKESQPQQEEVKSEILDTNEMATILKWFNNPPQFKSLLYRATTETFTPEHFHSAVGNEKNTLVVMKLFHGDVIGGFTSQSWNGEGFKEDPYSFLFNLSQNKVFLVDRFENAIYCSPKAFPVFGTGDLTINSQNVATEFPSSYRGSRLELTHGQQNLSLSKLEIFSLSGH